MYHIRANDARVKNDVASIVDEESRELHLESGRITRLKGSRQPQPKITGSDIHQASLMQPGVVKT